MTAEDEWLSAFPIRPAADAVDALCESWRFLATVKRQGFHPGIREPDLTRVLKAHVERVTAPSRGILGMWSTEGVINDFDPETAVLTNERRTDIVYGWNDDQRGLAIQLVFEFKKIDRHARSRQQYLGEDGLARFVTGIYSRHQSAAAMVGILLDPVDEVVPPIKGALSDTQVATTLKLRCRPSGEPFASPSDLFQTADFDTEHDRDPALASTHGTIRVAHIFLGFGYAVPKTSTKSKRKKTKQIG